MLTQISSRTLLVEELAAELERPGPSLIVLTARAADDPWKIVRAALASERPMRAGIDLAWTAIHTGSRLQRQAMAASLQAEVDRGSSPIPHDDPLGSEDTGPFVAAARVLASRIPVRLSLYGAEQLLADPETAQNLRALWSLARGSALPLHLILVVEDRVAEATALEALQPHELSAARLCLPLLSLHDLARALPGWNSDRIVSGRALLGGDAAVWSRVDPRASLSTNVCRLILSPDGPLFDRGWNRLAIGVQKPERYAEVLHAVAAGARDWGSIVAGSPAFTSASQLGPYMRQLESDGQVSAQRSLDAGPRSRRTRYRMVDSHQAFWFKHLLPLRSRLLSGSDPREIWRTDIRPRVRAFVGEQVPALLQAEIELEPVLGVRAREVGALWNEGCDFPVAGTLETGAVFYGRTWWADTPSAGVLEQMRTEMRETRYGFGRESRWRMLFVRLDPDHNWERQVARTADARFIGVDDVVGRSP